MSNHSKPDLKAALMWYRSNAKVVADYCGEWVAISSHGILAHGKDLNEVMAASKKQGIVRPLLYKVPPQGILALWWASDA
jgi:hypothetical protein